jgi:hypothetical protein
MSNSRARPLVPIPVTVCDEAEPMTMMSGEPPGRELVGGSTLELGESLRLRSLAAPAGRFVFAHRDDGTVTLSDRAEGTVIWTLDTDGRRVRDLTLRENGNLEAYDRDGRTLWASGTGGLPVARLAVGAQDVALPGGATTSRPTVALEDADGRPLWSVLRQRAEDGMSDSVTRGVRRAPVTMDDWRCFLTEYGADVLRTAEENSLWWVTDRQRADRWLGTTGATEAELTTLEERLGRALPPSLRAFLSASNGWTNLGCHMYRLRPAAQVGWFIDEPGGPHMIEIIREVNEELAEWMRRSLIVSAMHIDGESWLLDPAQVGPDGEWTARTWSHWGLEHRYRSFAALVERQRQDYEAQRASAGHPVDPAGAARLAEEGRIAALRGHIELALILLERASTKGSVVAVHLRAMLRCLTGAGDFGHLTRLGGLLSALPCGNLPAGVLRAEFVPLYLRAVAGHRPANRAREVALLGDLLPTVESRTDGGRADGSPEGWLARADAFTAAELPETPEFRAALDEAHRLVAAGDPQGAWRAVERGLPHWYSDEPYRAAPMVLLTDPLLRGVVATDRFRRIVTTPRQVR